MFRRIALDGTSCKFLVLLGTARELDELLSNCLDYVVGLGRVTGTGQGA